MVEYYPKNNFRPTIAAVIVGGAFILANEILRSVSGIGIPRYIGIPLALILGIIILVKMNPKEKNRPKNFL